MTMDMKIIKIGWNIIIMIAEVHRNKKKKVLISKCAHFIRKNEWENKWARIWIEYENVYVYTFKRRDAQNTKATSNMNPLCCHRKMLQNNQNEDQTNDGRRRWIKLKNEWTRRKTEKEEEEEGDKIQI